MLYVSRQKPLLWGKFQNLCDVHYYYNVLELEWASLLLYREEETPRKWGKLFKVTEYVGVRSASKTSSSDSPKLCVGRWGLEQLMSGDWGDSLYFDMK